MPASDNMIGPFKGGKLSSIKIEKVNTHTARKKFIKFPWKIYSGDPNWVPPMIIDIKERLDRKKNPFFEHAEMDLFLAYKDGKIVGRIAAILDESHNHTHEEKVVFFGMYESIDDDDVARALLDQAVAWGLERGMNTLRGPMNLSLNDECAFLVEGFDSPPVFMMTYNPPYYPELMEKSGLIKAKDLLAYRMQKGHDIVQKVEAIVAKVEKSTNYTLRTVSKENLDNDIEKIRKIYNEGWEKNWGFVPWTDKEIDHMAHKLKQFADWDIVILAEYKGKPAGFALSLPNYNEVLIKMNGRLSPLGILKFMRGRKKITGVRAIVFGILKEHRMSGLSYLLYWHMEQNSLKKGYTWAETSWTLEDNEAINRFAVSIGGRIYKTYRIYEKKIAN